MDRVSMVKQYVNQIIQRIDSEENRQNAYLHTYGVAQCCSLLATKRGFNPEIAYISGLLHDIYAYYTGSYLCHACSGADMVRIAIRSMNAFTEEEKVIILSAIYYHSCKDEYHDGYDEILKDADVLQPFLNNACSHVDYRIYPRLQKLLDELNLTSTPVVIEKDQETTTDQTFHKSVFADIAEELASKKIHGEKEDQTFMDIIKYYPEDSAFDELRNYWCAAFVYHCALKAGLELPIRQPPIQNRFAGVGPWYQWGKANDFCFSENDGFIPSRGDIVIYNNIITPDRKEKNSAWHDHIGIVLACESEYLIVAEGNINNENVSGVIKRKRDQTIGCFVSIPEAYVQDSSGCDYREYLKFLKV